MNDQDKGLRFKWSVLALLAELALIALGVLVCKIWANVNVWAGVAFCGILTGGVCIVLNVVLKWECDCRNAYYDHCKARMVAREQECRFSNALMDLAKTHASRCHGQGNDGLVQEVILTVVKINGESEARKG